MRRSMLKKFFFLFFFLPLVTIVIVVASTDTHILTHGIGNHCHCQDISRYTHIHIYIKYLFSYAAGRILHKLNCTLFNISWRLVCICEECHLVFSQITIIQSNWKSILMDNSCLCHVYINLICLCI